jgi:addiction module HigA family antidote
MTAEVPGLLIADTILPLYRRDVGRLARALKCSRPHCSALVNGHVRITVPMARRLEVLGHGTAREWLIRQVDYDLEQPPR